MNWLVTVSSVFLVAVPGWLLMRAVRMPAAPMMGGMISAAFFSVAGWGPQEAPAGLSVVLQIILGLFIGLRVTKEADRIVKEMGVVSLLASGWWLSLPLLLGWVLFRFFGMDLATALLGTVPGGLAEMSLLAFTFGADAAMVAIMQFCRLASAMLTIPVVARKYSTFRLVDGAGTPPGKKPRPAKKEEWRPDGPLLTAVALAVSGGLVGNGIAIPAGGFVGAMAFTGVASYFALPMRGLPKVSRDVAQLGLGSIIGLTATADTVALLMRIFLPTLAITAVMLLWGFALAFMVRRLSGWDFMTCLLATSPGGITQLAAITEDLGGDPLRVSLLHLVRLFTVYLLLPPLIVRMAG